MQTKETAKKVIKDLQLEAATTLNGALGHQRRCMEALEQDCGDLRELERRLQESLNKPGASWFGFSRVLRVAREGSQYVLTLLGSGALKTLKVMFRTITSLVSFLTPIVAKTVLFVVQSPYGALYALLYVRNLQRTLCAHGKQTSLLVCLSCWGDVCTLVLSVGRRTAHDEGTGGHEGRQGPRTLADTRHVCQCQLGGHQKHVHGGHQGGGRPCVRLADQRCGTEGLQPGGQDIHRAPGPARRDAFHSDCHTRWYGVSLHGVTSAAPP